MSDNQISVKIYDGTNWISVNNYLLSVGNMPQIFNNRDGSLFAPMLSIKLGVGLESVSSSTVSIYERFSKIRIFNNAETRLFFEGDFEYLTYDSERKEYDTQWAHEIGRLKKIQWKRDDFNALLTDSGDEDIYWEAGTPTTEAHITPQQVIRKIFSEIIEKTVDLNDFKLPSELEFWNFKDFQDCSFDRGHLFAAGQEFAGFDIGVGYDESYDESKRGTVFDVISDICKVHKVNIIYDRTTTGNYKLVIPAGFDLCGYGTAEKLNNLADNYIYSKSSKRADYTRSINIAYSTPDKVPTDASSTIQYEIFKTIPVYSVKNSVFDVELFSKDFAPLSADKNTKYVNDEVSAITGIKTVGSPTPKVSYLATGLHPAGYGASKRRYGMKIIEETVLTELVNSDVALAVKHDIKVNKGIAYSEITQEKRQWEEIIKNGELTSNTGGDCTIIVDAASTNNGYRARQAASFWESHNYSEFPFDAWIGIDMGLENTKTVDKIAYATYSGSSTAWGVVIEHSNDGVTWTATTTTADQSNGKIPELGNSSIYHSMQVRKVTSPVAKRFWRIRFEFGFESTTAKIKRIQFYERIL